MRCFRNFSLILRSRLTALQEKIEDPERMLHQLILDMEEELERIRGSVAVAFADEIQLGRRVERTRAVAQQWRERAETALQRRDEAAARSALEQQLMLEQRAETHAREYAQHQRQTARLHRAVRDLEDRIRQANEKRALLVARLNHAESAQRIQQALAGAEQQSAFSQMRRLEAQVERAEALEQAHDRLHERDPDEEDLARRFEEEERRARFQREFEELKRRVAED